MNIAMKRQVLSVLLTFISLSSGTDNLNGDSDCSSHPKESRNSTCCESPQIYSNQTIKLSDDKYSEKFPHHQNYDLPEECIYTNFLMETAGFFLEGKFHIKNFANYIKNNTEIVDQSEKVEEYFSKCSNLADQLNITNIQEKKFGIKLEDCNFKPIFMGRCLRIRAVNNL